LEQDLFSSETNLPKLLSKPFPFVTTIGNKSPFPSLSDKVFKNETNININKQTDMEPLIHNQCQYNNENKNVFIGTMIVSDQFPLPKLSPLFGEKDFNK